MRGEVISVDSFSGDGLITGEDGGRYTFTASSTRAALRTGDKVDFVGTDGVATDIIALSKPTSGLGVADYGYSQPGAGTGYNFLSAVFSFNGRLRRSHFWISWAIMCATWWVTFWIPLVNIIFQIVLLWSNLAVGAKRFHDMGKTGWLIAIPWVLLIGAQIAAIAVIGVAAISNPQAFENEDPAAIMGLMGSLGIFALIALPVSLGFWLWLGIADSQPGRNKYGPNPKNPVDDTANTFA
jgi:uncharacterized membrane protein YhaH (DUF805 family)